MTQEEYNSVLERIEESLSAVNTEYENTGKLASTLCDVNQIVNYNPDMQVVRNRGGDVIGYDYKYTTPVQPSTIGLQVNSNNDQGLYGLSATGGGGFTRGGGAGRYRASYYSGGVITDETSTEKMQGTGKVSGIISAAWGAVSALGKFGLKVAEDATDAIKQVANTVLEKYSQLSVFELSGKPFDGEFALRVLYDTDSTTGDVNMYMDADVLGALAIELRNAGLLVRSSSSTVEDQSVTGGRLRQPFTIIPAGWTTEIYTSNNGYTTRYTTLVDTVLAYNGPAFCAFRYDPRGTNCFKWETFDSNNNKINEGVRQITSTNSYTLNGKQVWTTIGYAYYPFGDRIWDGAQFVSGDPRPLATQFKNGGGGTPLYIDAWILAYGSRTNTNPVPGVTPWTGTTDMIDAITGADPHVVGENLYNQYPAAMGAPILINIMDDSCNPITKKYYKVPLSYSPTNNTLEVPVGLTGNLNPQINPSFNPNFNFDPNINVPNAIQQVADQLSGSGAGRDIAAELPDSEGTIPLPGIVPPVKTLDPTVPTKGTGATPEQELPQVDVRSMWHVYNPSSAELAALGDWLWSTNILDVLIRTFSNPLESIMGVHAIYGEPHVSGSESIVVGPLTSSVSSRIVTSQYTTVDCGSIWLTEYFGNVFDYYPYTKVSLFLPFVGIVELNTADIMRGKINVSYNIDVYTGAAVAFVSIERDDTGGVLYQYPANCAIEYPVSAASYSRLMQAIITTAVTGASIATDGGSSAALIGLASSTLSPNKIQVQRSGNFSGNIGAMGSKRPYLIITRPQTNMAINFQQYDGLASNFTTQIGSCKGYTKCKEVHLNCPGAYKDELDEIERLLRSGVILPDILS